jgi:D-sedoheptulose 7-phosphate isomerase
MTTAATASIVQAHFAASIAASNRFFDAEAGGIARCCRRMAERFAAGGTLFVAGEGAQASDAQHVSVEFVHPILVGKRALPAVALTAADGSPPSVALPVLARGDDILLVLAAGDLSPASLEALAHARQAGLLTVVVSGAPVPDDAADLAFAVGGGNPLIVQEVAETAYHVLWELVHVFLDRGDADLASFLAPARGRESDEDLLAAVVASTREKACDIAALRQAVCERSEAALADASVRLAAHLSRGGRLLTFGNGGSATDAVDAAIDAVDPPIAGWRAMPALALTADMGVITAIANDVGVEHVFARQIAAFGRAGDVALAFSTSGGSRNLLAAMAAARTRGLLTLAMSGGDGGALARSGDVDICITAPSEQLPRIQEAHATAWHALLTAAQERWR